MPISSSVSVRRRGFSLVELLVVISILAGLLAIVVPMVMKARRQAARTRQASDLQTIATALDAYHADFGDYPRPFAPGAGFATLGYALIAPGPATLTASNLPKVYDGSRVYEPGEIVEQSNAVYVAIARTSSSATADSPVAPPNVDYWAVCPYADGADGPGFRLRQQGQVYQPYLQAGRLKLRGYAILDQWDNPVLYFPARTGVVNTNNDYSYVWDSRDTTKVPTPKPLYDFVDNICILGGKLSNTNVDLTQMSPVLKFFGETKTQDGKLEAGESHVTTGNYVLWSAGADAEGVHSLTPATSGGNPPYGFDSKGKTDDITNFDIDGSLLK